jgi:dTDP-4-amino-4,6-dideoxygalactose transaminase
MKYIPYGRQYIDKEDISFVIKALKNDLITTGQFVNAFEKKISKKLNVPYVYSCSSGTAALHLAFLAIGLSEKDTIIIPAINFIASANIASQMKVKIFFADVDPVTGQSSPEKITDCIEKNKIKNLKAIVTMYNGGYPRDIIKFNKLRKKFRCFLIEDSCHALGAKYINIKKYEKIGSCKHSDISTFSLHPLKSITSGEGGIVTTRNKFIAEKIRLFRSHGIIRKKYHWNYDVKINGLNYRLSDINCALAFSQIKKLEKFVAKRRKIFNLYYKHLNNYKNICSIVKQEKKTSPAFHLVFLELNYKKLKKNKNDLIYFLMKKKIIAQFHYIPFFKFSFFKKRLKPHKNKFQGSKEFSEKVFSLPIYFTLKEKEVLMICNHIKKFINLNLN